MLDEAGWTDIDKLLAKTVWGGPDAAKLAEVRLAKPADLKTPKHKQLAASGAVLAKIAVLVAVKVSAPSLERKHDTVRPVAGFLVVESNIWNTKLFRATFFLMAEVILSISPKVPDVVWPERASSHTASAMSPTEETSPKEPVSA